MLHTGSLAQRLHRGHAAKRTKGPSIPCEAGAISERVVLTLRNRDPSQEGVHRGSHLTYGVPSPDSNIPKDR